MSITLLIDADILAYHAAASNEERTEWGEDVVTVNTDFDGAKDAVRHMVSEYIETLDATDVVMCLSDDLKNFRKTVDSTYKMNRSKHVRPELLYDVKDWMEEEYTVERREWLEADDVMGIMATEPHEGQRIIVSEDKDMLTIPAPLYRPHKPMLGVHTPTVEEADRFRLWQALTGDPVDGYKGCPGIGPVAADRALDKCEARVPYEHVLKRGKDAGKVTIRYRWEQFDSPWEAVLACFEAAGLTEQHATTQVNLARILRHGDYDQGTVIPWVPN